MTDPAAFTFVPTGRDAQRMLLAGQTRSGKTTLAVQLANQADRVVWVDPKRGNDPGWPVVSALDFLNAKTPRGRWQLLTDTLTATPRIVVQFADLPGVPDEAQLEAVAEAVYHLGDVLFVLDDTMGVATSTPTFWVNRVLTMGASRGCGFLACTQRVLRIPLVFLTEAQHIVSFVVYGDADEARLVKDGDAAFAGARNLDRYHFIWCDRPARAVRAFGPLPRPEAA